jgi:hypothetical protein
MFVIFPIAAIGCHADHFPSHFQLSRSDSTSSNKALQKKSKWAFFMHSDPTLMTLYFHFYF